LSVAMPGACLRDRINTSCLGLEFWYGARFKNHIRTIFPSGHASHVLIGSIPISLCVSFLLRRSKEMRLGPQGSGLKQCQR
jgi:hypothetical protein